VPVGLNPSRSPAGSDSALKRSAGKGSALAELSSNGSNVVLAPGRAARHGVERIGEDVRPAAEVPGAALRHHVDAGIAGQRD
jgi:hypothetical protein